MKHAAKHSDGRRHSSRQALPYPYNSDDQTVVRVRKKRHKHRGRKIALTVLAIVVAVLLIAGAALAMYMKSLDDRMSLGTDSEELSGVLHDVQLEDPFYVLILGTDSRAESKVVDAAGDKGRSDIMMLARVDTVNNKVTLITIPRDTPYVEPDGTVVKINSEFSKSPAATVEAVEDLTGVRISHYVNISFANFERLIDYLGGVEVDVPIEITNYDVLEGGTVTLEPGKQTLNGQQALVYARSRFDYDTEGDVHRQSAVRDIVSGIIDKVRAKPVNQLPLTVQELANCVSTDYQSSQIVRLAMVLTDGELTVYSASGPYSGDFITSLEGEPWMCYEDAEGWQRLMDTVNAGEDPAGISYIGDMVRIPGSDETFVLETDNAYPDKKKDEDKGDDASAEEGADAPADEAVEAPAEEVPAEEPVG